MIHKRMRIVCFHCQHTMYFCAVVFYKNLLLSLIAGFLLFCTAPANAQMPRTNEGLKQPRVLILLDGSSSMLQPWGQNSQRFSTAAKLILDLMDSLYKINGAVEFALRVYGHEHPAQEQFCYDSRLEVNFSKDNYTQMQLRLASLKPRGVSPIAWSLQQAAENDLTNDLRNAYSIILITDGGESCNGDICSIVQNLLAKKIFFKPYILSLVESMALQTSYQCLGTYLQVAKEGEMGPAIKTIAESYRPLLTLPQMKIKPAQMHAVAPAPKTAVVQAAEPAVVVSIPKWVGEKANLDKIPVKYQHKTLATAYALPRPLRRPVPLVAIPKVDVPPPVAAPPPPPPKPAETTVKIVKATPPPPPATNKLPQSNPPKPMDATYIKQIEDAAETMLTIYFTDGHGKYYKHEPALDLIDPLNGKSVKSFFRTVNSATGEPEPMKQQAGTYNLMLTTKGKIVYKNIVIEEKKNNKISVVVTPGSLKFEYAGNPKRPVSEFEAVVKRNFDRSPPVRQVCTAELPFDPANYHVEINTLPITVRSVDIFFGSETIVEIREPGYLQIINGNPLGLASFYFVLGDKFVRFTDLAITGNTETQKLRLQPGVYEVHWRKSPRAAESVQRFDVKSNSITQIELES